MKQTNTFDWLKGSLSHKNGLKRFNSNLSRLVGVLAALGVSVPISGAELGSPPAIAFPRIKSSNPYVTIFNVSSYGPTRAIDGTISATLRSAIKYGWDFSAIAQDFQQMGLMELLNDQGSIEGNMEENTILYTVFIPTNEEWQTLAPAVRTHPETLEKILRYHIVPGAVTQTQLESGKIQTLSGATLTIQKNASDDHFLLNQNVEIISTLRTQNGVIVFVNQPLIPPQN